MSYDEEGKFKYFSPNIKSEQEDCATDPILGILSNGGSLLVYISKNKIYEGAHLIEFDSYISACAEIKDQKALKLIENLKEFIGAEDGETDKHSEMIEMMKKGVVIHHGSIPLRGRLIIEEFVRLGAARICFATSTLNQGINMPFDAVWIDNFTKMPSLDLKNLIGRAGRTTNQYIFDYGYAVVKRKNVKTFSKRYKEVFKITETSDLDIDIGDVEEDSKDIVEALRNDSFNDSLHLPQTQVDRLSDTQLDKEILFIMDNLLEHQQPITGNAYTKLDVSTKAEIKTSFKKIYLQHLRRRDLTKAEEDILNAAIPILLWNIQGRSFSEVVSLRHAYLSQKNERNRILAQVKKGLITKNIAKKQIRELQVEYSQVPSSIPDKTLRPYPTFPYMSVDDLEYDLIVYDTYDYLDKVIALSLVDPICAAFELYFERKNDNRANALVNYIRYGTNDNIEILLMRYGFGFEEIEWLKDYVLSIDESRIEFKDSISELSPEKMALINRYL